MEKEVQIRKKISRYFNKRQEDFPSLRAFNDYLEEAEEIIFNMCNNVDVQDTEEKIEKFRLENKELIAQNLAKQKAEAKQISTLLDRGIYLSKFRKKGKNLAQGCL